MYSKNYKRNIVMYWRQWFPEWNIPKGYHVHHIKPKCTFKDKNDPRIHHPSNLIALHPDDHVTIHSLRGDKRAANGGFLNMRDYKHSEETKSKMKESAKNRPPQSQETRNKHSKSLIGKSKSPEHIKNMVLARAGWKHSTESKQKISDANRGTNNSMFGKHHTTESINKQKDTKASAAWKNDNTFVCPQCQRSITGKGAFNRWHGDKCKGQ